MFIGHACLFITYSYVHVVIVYFCYCNMKDLYCSKVFKNYIFEASTAQLGIYIASYFEVLFKSAAFII